MDRVRAKRWGMLLPLNQSDISFYATIFKARIYLGVFPVILHRSAVILWADGKLIQDWNHGCLPTSVCLKI